MSIRFACSRSAFKPWTSLLIFCLVDLSDIDSGVLKFNTIIVWEFNSFCKSLRTCLRYLGAPVLGPYMFRIVDFSCCIDFFYHYVMAFFVSFDLCCFKIYFLRYENCNSCFLFIYYLFLLSICLVNVPPSLYVEPLCILVCEMGFLDTAH